MKKIKIKPQKLFNVAITYLIILAVKISIRCRQISL